MPGAVNPLEVSLTGYVRVTNSGPDGFAIGGYSRDADSARQYATEREAVVSIKRAREIARDIHGWDIASEEELYSRNRAS